MPESPAVAARSIVWPGEPKPHATMQRMRFITLEQYRDPAIVATAGRIADEVDGKDRAAMTRAILLWLREHTRFVPDPKNQQLLKVPMYMLDEIRAHGHVAADCVDVAMLAAALALAVGMDVQFVAEGYCQPCDPERCPLVHVYTTAQTQDGWIMMDTQQPPDGPLRTPCRRMVLPLL